MRGLLQAAVVLAPVASAFVLPGHHKQESDLDGVADRSSAFATDVEVTRTRIDDASSPVPHIEVDFGFPVKSLESEFAELDWLLAQMHELEFLIAEKEQSIAYHATEHYHDEIKDCDSLKCVISGVAKKAKNAAHHVYGKIAGKHGRPGPPGPPGPPGRHPQDRSPPQFPGEGKYPKHSNHTYGPPNGTHPPPHWRRPHHFLPICRFPPPPHHKHHGPPRGPKHHKRPGHGNHGPGDDDMPPPPPPHFPHHGPEDGDRRPGDHDRMPPHFPHRRPEDENGRPEDDDMMPPHDPHGRPLDENGRPLPPPEDRLHHEDPMDRQDAGRDFPHPKGPPHGKSGDEMGHPDMAPHHHPEHDSPPGRPEHGDDDEPHPPFGDGPGRQGPHGPPPGMVLHILKFSIIGFLFALFLLALRRRCAPSSKAARKARREERRARRRVAHKNAITRLLARISGNSDEASGDYDEKRTALLSDMEDGVSTTMTEEIVQLQNAASVVDDMVSHEETRVLEPLTYPPQSQIMTIPVQGTSLMREYNDEDLPAYEDDDSEIGSIVSDGFRYTPGSSNYSPSHSASGSVSDILGPDTKN